jgi:hypothetical protein
MIVYPCGKETCKVGRNNLPSPHPPPSTVFSSSEIKFFILASKMYSKNIKSLHGHKQMKNNIFAGLPSVI